jgi:ubiquinone/menaquinone biosynthesis C-methylase UbiE
MDDTTKYNEEQWDELVHSGVPCSKPSLEATAESAKDKLNKDGIFGDLKGKKVLCLASGGGQQSIEFALLGADVTVVDFSSAQLEKDKIVSEKFSLPVRIIKTDMRELTMFNNAEFDIVYQPYSINYIPGTEKVFDEVSRIIKSGGIYYLMFHNPFVHGSWRDGCWGSRWDKKELWHGKGYPIWQSYKEGVEIKTEDPNWNLISKDGEIIKIKSPQEFRHTLSTVFNGVITRGFEIIKFDEYTSEDPHSEPGTWEHYVSCTAPWLYLWAKKK